MATSGTTSFDPALGSLAAYALGRVDVRRTAILQEHLTDTYLAANLLVQSWSNDQPLLWDVDLQSVLLTQGQQTVTCPADTILIGDAYIQIPVGNGVINNRVIFPVSRTEYSSYPNPYTQAFPSVYWFNRQIVPSINLYATPDANYPYTLFYWRFKQSQDAVIAGGLQLAIPPRWLMAFVDGLAEELSYTYKPAASQALAAKAARSYQLARIAEREVVDVYIQPGLSFYYSR